MIHVDTWGTYHTKTYDNHSYFLTIMDDYSRATWTHLLSTKSNAFRVIKGFIEMIETKFGRKLKVLRTDNAFKLGSSNEGIILYKKRYHSSNKL